MQPRTKIYTIFPRAGSEPITCRSMLEMLLIMSQATKKSQISILLTWRAQVPFYMSGKESGANAEFVMPHTEGIRRTPASIYSSDVHGTFYVTYLRQQSRIKEILQISLKFLLNKACIVLELLKRKSIKMTAALPRPQYLDDLIFLPS